jgi:hypothetical protein
VSYSLSDEDQATVTTERLGECFSKFVDVNEHRLSGYNVFYEKSGAVEPSNPLLPPAPQKAAVQSHHSVRRDLVRRSLKQAEEEAARMEAFAKAGELMELSNAGFRLKDALQQLWQLRNEREDDWGDLLTMLQAALAQEEFERFTPRQCYAVRCVIADHLGSGIVDIDDIERSIRLLREAGFDPWKGISGAIESEE